MIQIDKYNKDLGMLQIHHNLEFLNKAKFTQIEQNSRKVVERYKINCQNRKKLFLIHKMLIGWFKFMYNQINIRRLSFKVTL